MDALTTALKRSDCVVSTAHTNALTLKQSGMISSELSPSFGGNFGFDQGRARSARMYSLNRGWLYSAVNALSCEAAGQPVNLGRLTDEEGGSEHRNSLASSFHLKKMTDNIRSKAVHGVEIVHGTPLSMALENPNSIQSRWEFVYSFVANLNITGWSYIIADVNEDGEPEFYSIPTTWITPVHEKGQSFASFILKNPDKPGGIGQILNRNQVAFAHLPNPADPLHTALAPAVSQIQAIRIDDHIQTSQERFFQNGVFPSVILTVGKNPHPDVPGGIRPRLTGVQRREVTGAIRKTVQGIANYGNPAIVDGLIEKIERLSATQIEMGWEKSEDAVMDRILSAFSVPPFMLGKSLPGSYAQAYVVQRIFCNRVNTFLDMLSTVMTQFVNFRMEQDDDVLIWWDSCEPIDPSIENKMILEGRKLNDITQDEYRAHLGFPPSKKEKRSKFFDAPAGLRSVNELFTKVRVGDMSVESAAHILSGFFEISLEEAKVIVGDSGEIRVVEESVRMLKSAVERLNEPIQIDLKHDDIDEGIVEIVGRTIEVEKTVKSIGLKCEEEVESMDDEIYRLRRDLDTEKVITKSKLHLISEAAKKSSELTIVRIESAVSSIRSFIAENNNTKMQTTMVKKVLGKLSDNISDSLGVIEKATEQPINIEVTNEVNPTPIEITNKVETPKVEVDVKNIVETPEVNIEVDAPNVKVEPRIQVDVPETIVNVDAPNVTVEPKIQVDVPKIEVPAAEIEINVTREDAPKKATITHPDNRVSQVELKE